MTELTKAIHKTILKESCEEFDDAQNEAERDGFKILERLVVPVIIQGGIRTELMFIAFCKKTVREPYSARPGKMFYQPANT